MASYGLGYRFQTWQLFLHFKDLISIPRDRFQPTSGLKWIQINESKVNVKTSKQRMNMKLKEKTN